MAAPTHLRVEHLDYPLGLTVSKPRLSWRLPADAKHQLAYQLRAGLWDSGRVESDHSLLVPYDGPPSASGERVEWTVKVWTEAGESDWAERSWWEMGLLRPEDWVVRWIAPSDAGAFRDHVPHPAWLLRGAVILGGPIKRARLYVTAHGMYEFFINGSRVGDMELTPGFTSYKSILQVQTFDVTEHIQSGENMLGAILSGGWLKWSRLYRATGPELGLLAQLDVLHGLDESLTQVGTGPDWVTATGDLLTADLQQGQVADLRREKPGWCTAGAEHLGWSPVAVHNYDLTRLRCSPSPPVRRVEHLRPVGVNHLAPDRQLVDLGQNINGWVRLTNLGPVGTTLTLTHGETLDATGDVTLDHISDDEPRQTRPFQRDQVTSAGREGDVFEPRHTTHGFRYVRVEGHPGELSADDVTGVAVHTEMRRTGWFECSDERINKLHEAAVWSFRSNACDIPTDCPTRERGGWTGDWQVFVSTAAFLYDVAGFSTKWLRDLAADQRPTGVVPHCAPNPQIDEFHPAGSAGWGDAAVIVPWEIYRAYADRDVLSEQWSSMTAWVDYAARAARKRRHPNRAIVRAIPAAHEKFIWDTGFHWGEWLEPAWNPGVVSTLATADHGSVATAYLHYSARLLAGIADLLGRDNDAARYGRLAAATRTAWQTEFLGPDGAVSPNTQASYVRALAFGLVPGHLRTHAMRYLVDLIRKADTHLGTGFLATPHLLPVLADNGHLDLAYELLMQDTEPSWLTMIDRGATTIWEHWAGLGEHGLPAAPHGVGSLNHYSKGAVISFLHRYVAGIQLLDDAPAYRRFRISPQPGGGLTFSRAVHDSPYGQIESSWQIVNDDCTLEVAVPAGATAEIRLPDGRTFEANSGRARYRFKARSSKAARLDELSGEGARR